MISTEYPTPPPPPPPVRPPGRHRADAEAAARLALEDSPAWLGLQTHARCAGPGCPERGEFGLPGALGQYCPRCALVALATPGGLVAWPDTEPDAANCLVFDGRHVEVDGYLSGGEAAVPVAVLLDDAGRRTAVRVDAIALECPCPWPVPAPRGAELPAGGAR